MLNLSNREILLVKWSIKEWRKKDVQQAFFSRLLSGKEAAAVMK